MNCNATENAMGGAEKSDKPMLRIREVSTIIKRDNWKRRREGRRVETGG